jgi:hypothetical protein
VCLSELDGCAYRASYLPILHQRRLSGATATITPQVIFVENGRITACGTFADVARTSAYRSWVKQARARSESETSGGEQADADAVGDGKAVGRDSVVDGHLRPQRHSMPAAALLQALTAKDSAAASNVGKSGDDADGGGGDHVPFLQAEKQTTGRVSGAVVSRFITQMGRVPFYATALTILLG